MGFYGGQPVRPPSGHKYNGVGLLIWSVYFATRLAAQILGMVETGELCHAASRSEKRRQVAASSHPFVGQSHDQRKRCF